MLNFDTLAKRPVTPAPFPHVTAVDLLPAEAKASIAADFPDTDKTGFFPVEDLTFGPAFAELIEDLRSPEFARIVGDKLGKALVDKPKIIVVRKWSAAKDGRPHTDGADKVATALVYLNDDWGGSDGSLRMLEGPDVEGPGTDPIPASYGSLVAFARADNSWHGHKPFAGERRVIQTTWLLDSDAAARKDKRHKRTHFFKSLWPF